MADIDLMIDAFLRIRARPDEEDEIHWQFENVTFLLNIVDELAGDDKYIPIRKRKPRHSTLRTVEAAINEARENESAQSFEFQRNFDEEIKKAQAENDKIIEKFQKRREDLEKKQRSGGNVSLTELQQAIQELAEQNALLQRKLEIKREQLERDRDVEIQRIRREADLDIQKTQNMYKLWAVIVPPIPPFLVGLVVFVVRRLREREGISKARLR
ncbi:MAG: hypothetical protein R3C99_22420 [Pirellulaceae bacterium]